MEKDILSVWQKFEDSYWGYRWARLGNA